MKELTIQHQYKQERRENCRMSMVMDRSTSIEEFPEIKSGGKDVSTPLLRLHVVVSYVSRGLSVMKELTIQHQYNEEWNEPARKEGKL